MTDTTELELETRFHFKVYRFLFSGFEPRGMTFPFRGKQVHLEVTRKNPEKGITDVTITANRGRHPIPSDQIKDRVLQVPFHSGPSDPLHELNQKLQGWDVEASAAYEQWIQVSRFKTKNASLGRPPSVVPSESTAGQLNNLTNGVRIVTHRAEHYGSKLVQERHWHAIEAALQAEEKVPLPWQLLFDAEYLVGTDPRRAVIDAAVAAEVHMKEELDAQLSKLKDGRGVKLGEAAKKHLINAAKGNLIGFFKETLADDDQDILDGLMLNQERGLFAWRNTGLHKGEAITVEDGHRLVANAETLLRLKPQT